MDPPVWITRLRDNVTRVRERVDAACRRAGRDPADVCLVGVTKYASPPVLREVVAAGVADLGESRVQQLVSRAQAGRPPRFGWPWPADGAERSGPRWHMIGHLQRNKVKALLPHARIIHSVDSVRLVETIEQHATALDVLVDVLVEVNVAGEASKQGIAPGELEAMAAALRNCAHLRWRGLMTMAPYDPEAEAARPHFVRLRELLNRLRATDAAPPDCAHLSMGMSQDYAVAVEEGATLVRVGSALFEGLAPDDLRAGRSPR